MRYLLLAALSLCSAASAVLDKDLLWFAVFAPAGGLEIEFNTEAKRVRDLCKKPSISCYTQRVQHRTWNLGELRSEPEPTSQYIGKIEGVMHVPSSEPPRFALRLRVVTYKPESQEIWIPEIADWQGGVPLYVTESRRDWIRLPEWLSATPLWLKLNFGAVLGKADSTKGKVARFETAVKVRNRRNNNPEVLPAGYYFFLSTFGGNAEVRSARRRDLACDGEPDRTLATEAATGEYELELTELFDAEDKPRFTLLPPGKCP